MIFVAVLDEAALLAARHRDRLAAARGKFKQAAPASFVGAGDGARADQVAGQEIAAIRGVMRHHLRHRPVHHRERGLGEAERRRARAPHRLRRHVGFERDVEAALRAICGVVEMRQRRRIALRPCEGGGAERQERFLRHHPGRHGGGEILSQKRAERLVFESLHVARRPVVQETEAENMLRRLADRDGFAEFGRHADVEAELQLEIEIARRSVARRRFLRALALAARPLDRRAADPNRRGAAVIGNRHVFVVRQQRIVGPKRAPGIGGVEDRGVEVGEIADRDRQGDLGLRHRRQMPPQALVAAIRAQAARQRQPERRPRRRSERHEMIEMRRGTGFCRPRRQVPRRMTPPPQRRESDRRSRRRRAAASCPPGDRRRTANSGSGSRCPGALALSTKLRRAGSCVSLSCNVIARC